MQLKNNYKIYDKELEVHGYVVNSSDIHNIEVLYSTGGSGLYCMDKNCDKFDDSVIIVGRDTAPLIKDDLSTISSTSYERYKDRLSADKSDSFNHISENIINLVHGYSPVVFSVSITFDSTFHFLIKFNSISITFEHYLFDINTGLIDEGDDETSYLMCFKGIEQIDNRCGNLEDVFEYLKLNIKKWTEINL